MIGICFRGALSTQNYYRDDPVRARVPELQAVNSENTPVPVLGQKLSDNLVSCQPQSELGAFTSGWKFSQPRDMEKLNQLG